MDSPIEWLCASQDNVSYSVNITRTDTRTPNFFRPYQFNCSEIWFMIVWVIFFGGSSLHLQMHLIIFCGKGVSTLTLGCSAVSSSGPLRNSNDMCEVKKWLFIEMCPSIKGAEHIRHINVVLRFSYLLSRCAIIHDGALFHMWKMLECVNINKRPFAFICIVWEFYGRMKQRKTEREKKSKRRRIVLFHSLVFDVPQNNQARTIKR